MKKKKKLMHAYHTAIGRNVEVLTYIVRKKNLELFLIKVIL